MQRTPVAIIGTGMAGLGAGYALESLGEPFVCYDKNDYFGGHTRSIHYPEGFVFDDGGHISFSRDERIKALLAENVGHRYEEKKLAIDNYWRGRRIPHPVQCNLRSLPQDLIVAVIADFVARHSGEDRRAPETYMDWLLRTYGKTFAETFPAVYGEKYHTTAMDRLTTDWIGPRMYQPTLEEVVRGALSDSAADVHYVDTFRYPTVGGFVSFITPFARRFDVRLDHTLTALDARKKLLRFSNGKVESYSQVISSMPLPELIPLIDGVPSDVVESARSLAFTSAVLVNIGLDRSDISGSAITYFYDPDISISRVNLPHLLSSNNAPAGCGNIQAEIYFSDKYKPLRTDAADLARRAVEELRRCDFVRDGDKILVCATALNRYANIIYDQVRTAALGTVHGFLDDIGVRYCGRYGRWNHAWTDQAFMDGEATAREAVKA